MYHRGVVSVAGKEQRVQEKPQASGLCETPDKGAKRGGNLMLPPTQQAGPVTKNHPSAVWMLVIAFINQNIVIAVIWGPLSVLFGAVETRLGIGRELSTLAVPAVQLAARYARRWWASPPGGFRSGCC